MWSYPTDNLNEGASKSFIVAAASRFYTTRLEVIRYHLRYVYINKQNTRHAQKFVRFVPVLVSCTVVWSPDFIKGSSACLVAF